MSSIYVKPLATSLSLYLTTSLLLFLLQTKAHLNPTGKSLGGVGIALVNTFHFLSEANSTWIASFHLGQSERFSHSAMVFGSWSFRRLFCNCSWEIYVENYRLTVVRFSRIYIVCGNFIYPCWLFVISQYDWVRVFRCPSHWVHNWAGLWRLSFRRVFITHLMIINARLIYMREAESCSVTTLLLLFF